MIRISARDVTPRECEQCKNPFVPIKCAKGRFCSQACNGAYKSAHTVRVPDEKSSDEPGVVWSRGRRRNARLIAAGLCVTCKTPHDRGTNRCAECTKKAIMRNLRTKQEAREQKLCVICRKPWSGETKSCAECKEKQQSNWSRRADSNFCSRCGSEKNGTRKSCSSCLEKMRAQTKLRRDNLAAEDRCIRCGTPKTGPSFFCDRHIFHQAARRWLGNSKHWHELASLFAKQGGRCVYTGELLVLGGNASLDHKVPRSRGGDNTIDNVQWVTLEVNRIKNDMTHHEFVGFCQLITERHS
jgi:hypothetical protein